MDFLDFIIVVMVIAVVVLLLKGMSNAKKQNGTDQAASTQTVGTATIVDGDKQQIIEDIKATQTSRVVDQVAILDDLGTTTQNYRQFCELAGTTQKTGGVTAPYSKRQVAYYDVRCYKIERVNGREIETLVAQERSIEPFYFTDDSCDTKVYVALDTFGKNVILVNSMNHIEGPTSDFSKAVTNRTASISGTGAAKLMVAHAEAAALGALRGLRNAWSWTVLAPERAKAAMDAAYGFAGLGLQPAFAGAGVSGAAFGAAGVAGGSAHGARTRHVRFAGGPGGPGGGRAPQGGGFGGGRPSSQHPIGSGKPQQHSANVSLGSGKTQPTISFNIGSTGGKIPTGLDAFLGLGGTGMGGLQQNPYLGGPMSPYYGGFGTGKTGTDLGSTLLNIGLGALLASMSSSGSNTHTSAPSYTGGAPASTYTQTNNTFQGYRVVEDVVPLGYPVYCIGDLYRNAQDVYMGKAMGTVSQSYYFATKLEAEVIAHLQK